MKTKADKESIILCRTVGFAIKERRKELGYSGTDMANLLKISQQQYSRYERGQSQITATMLFKIAGILQYPICLFFSNYICDHVVEYPIDTKRAISTPAK